MTAANRALIALVLVSLVRAPVVFAQVAGEGVFSVERFRPAGDGDGFFGVEWGAVLPHRVRDVSIWLGGAGSPLVIYDQVDGSRQPVGALVSRRITGTLTAAVGLWDMFQLGVELPVILSQSGDMVTGFTPLDQLGSAGLGDMRLVPKLRIAATGGFSLALIPALTLPFAASSGYRGDTGVTFAPELVLSREIAAARVSMNLGYRARPDREFLDLTIGDEWFAHAGVAYGLSSVVSVPVELCATVSAATLAARPLSAANQDYFELAGGVRYQLGASFQLMAAYATGLGGAYGSPGWRWVAGVRVLGRRPDRDPDRDHIVGAADACPREPEDFDGFADDDGCPDPDNDADGVLDREDGAPLAPEDRDGYQDDDGVPDPDNDGDFIPDVDDRCPLAAEVVNGHEDDDGCPDQVPDSDGDGLDDLSGRDQCPLQAEDFDGHEDGDGCPDPDNDGDGVLDDMDACIDLPGPVSNGGCPVKPPQDL